MNPGEVEWHQNPYVKTHYITGISGLLLGTIIAIIIVSVTIKFELLNFIFVFSILAIIFFKFMIDANKEMVPRKIGFDREGFYLKYVEEVKTFKWRDIDSIELKKVILKNKCHLKLKSSKIIDLSFIDDGILDKIIEKNSKLK
jgi:hypothetical protein